MELKITKERVLEAALKCSQAKETLKTLFPEAFEVEPAFTGTVWVESVSGYPAHRCLAVSHPGVLDVLKKDYPTTDYKSVVVLVMNASPESRLNGWPVYSWKQFKKEWQIIR